MTYGEFVETIRSFVNCHIDYKPHGPYCKECHHIELCVALKAYDDAPKPIIMEVVDCHEGSPGLEYEDGCTILALKEVVDGKAVPNNPDDIWGTVFTDGAHLHIEIKEKSDADKE